VAQGVGLEFKAQYCKKKKNVAEENKSREEDTNQT
jgi:hypothetical protein